MKPIKININIKTNESSSIRLFAEVALLVDKKSFQKELRKFRKILKLMPFFQDRRHKKYRIFPINYSQFEDWLDNYLVWEITQKEIGILDEEFENFKNQYKGFTENLPLEDLSNVDPNSDYFKKRLRQVETPYFFYLNINKIRKRLKRPIYFLNIIAKAIICEEVKEKDFQPVKINRDGKYINISKYYLEPKFREKKLIINFPYHISDKKLIELKNKAKQKYENEVLGYKLPKLKGLKETFKRNRNYYWLRRTFKKSYLETYKYGVSKKWEIKESKKQILQRYQKKYHEINNKIDQAVKSYASLLNQ